VVPRQTTAFDLEWQVGDLATQLFGLNGLSLGTDKEKEAHTAKPQACESEF